MDLFPREFVLELNTKNLGNSPSFRTITHTTLSTKRLGTYLISTINVTNEFCFGTEQRWNKSSIFCLGWAKTPEVMNIISDDNSLSFPMVHQTAPNG
jgi:hypothetical protein